MNGRTLKDANLCSSYHFFGNPSVINAIETSSTSSNYLFKCGIDGTANPFLEIFKLRDKLNSLGIKMSLGLGDHQSTGISGSYHGKIPCL